MSNRYFNRIGEEISTTSSYVYGDYRYPQSIFWQFTEDRLNEIGILVCHDAPEKTAGEVVEIDGFKVTITPNLPKYEEVVLNTVLPTWQVVIGMSLTEYLGGSLADAMDNILASPKDREGIIAKGYLRSPELSRNSPLFEYLVNKGIPSSVIDSAFFTTYEEFLGEK